MTTTLSPVGPHELPPKMRRRMELTLNRVTEAAAREGLGADFLLRVYMAGFYHGAATAAPGTV